MSENNLVTVAIHTYDHALALKNLLEREGVPARLQNVNLNEPEVSVGMRVRIDRADLPLALRIIENADIFHSDESQTGKHPIIVPVDFSAHSLKACDIAFQLAERRNSSVILLNSFFGQSDSVGRQLGKTLNFDTVDSARNMTLAYQAKSLMDSLANDIRKKIKLGELPAVKFTTLITEGIPEEVITDVAKQRNPELIVMGTRTADKKERELIGSVTAEVLDSSRFPILAIPELVQFSKVSDLHNVLFFCTLDQDDIIAVDTIYRFFNHENVAVELVWLPPKKQFGSFPSASALNSLASYCSAHYPRFTFNTHILSVASASGELAVLTRMAHINLMVIPNKRRSMFSRLFNPSLAHRLLFYADIPMMVIPV